MAECTIEISTLNTSTHKK